MASCVAVLSATNAPLFVLSDSTADGHSDGEGDLADHYSLHTSLDVIEEKTQGGAAGAGAGGAASSVPKRPADAQGRELYLGSLFTTEKKKVYGYVTNTRVKFVIVVDAGNTALRDNEVRQMFRKLHLAYSQLVCNPFYAPGGTIKSKRFSQVVRSLLASQQAHSSHLRK